MKHRLLFWFVIIITIGMCYAQPVIGSSTPSSAYQGESVTLMVTGSGFSATPAVPSADLGAGITVTSVTRLLATLISVDIDIDILAIPGSRNLIITNADGLADTLIRGFEVLNADTVAPVVELLFPLCGDTIACNDSSIIFDVDDIHGFIHESIMININGITYGIFDPELTVVDDTLIVYTPATPFPDRVFVRFQQIADSLGNIDSLMIDCDFRIDTIPPIADDLWPPPFGSTRELAPLLIVEMSDIFSGIDTSSIVLTVNGVDYSWPDPSMEFDGDSLKWDAVDAGVLFGENDTINCCFHVTDNAFGCGGPNVLDTCWYFRVLIPPPTEISMRIAAINPVHFPQIWAKVECYDEEERALEHLNRNNFKVSERNADGSWQREYPIFIENLHGTNIADIVFVIDDTGSMGGLITEVRDGVSAFAESLAVSGINYRLGLCTFSDTVDFSWGYDMTGDVSLFQTWVGGIVATGGGDGPEVSLDGITDAIDSMHFRPRATKVIVMVTDIGPHWRGDGTAFSDVLPDEVLANALDNDVLVFCVHDGWSTVDTNFVRISEETGGQWYEDSDFPLILAEIAEMITGGYNISWTSHNPIPDCRLRDTEIICAYPNIEIMDISDDDILAYQSPCSPEAMIIEPLPDRFTSNSHQQIIMDFSDIIEGVNPNSFQLVVDGQVYMIDSPQLAWNEPRLTWTPTDADSFTHHQEVLVNLAKVLTNLGHMPYHGPVVWRFKVDLRGPVASAHTPPPEALVGETQPIISVDITDDYAGVYDESIIIAIESKETRSYSPPRTIMLDVGSQGVNWDGRTFSFDPAIAGITFYEPDTVCVRIMRAVDLIRELDMTGYFDYGDPNELRETTLAEWCFYIPDDDTLCPEFSDFAPIYPERLMPHVPFDITVTIEDPSDVYDDGTGSDGQGVYLLWDDDGSIDDGTSNEILMSHTSGDTYQTDIPVPGQSENALFVWAVFAYDNDFENENPDDRTGCLSEVQTLCFGEGPIATVVMPLDYTVTTDPFQPIHIKVLDEESPIDTMSIELVVNSTPYTIHDDELSFVDDTLIEFIPTPDEWSDGDTVYVNLTAAADSHGLLLQNPTDFQFFVDISAPYVPVSSVFPPEGYVTLDLDQEIQLEIIDLYRDVDEESIVMIVNDDTLNTSSVGLTWNSSADLLVYSPGEAEMSFLNGDSVCVSLIGVSDVEADYGYPNVMEDDFNWCFFVSVTGCEHSPNIITPNGDGINDEATFSYPGAAFGDGILKIFESRRGMKIWDSSEDLPEYEFGPIVWDGRDGAGDPVPPGLYIFSIEDDGESVCSGSIAVVR